MVDLVGIGDRDRDNQGADQVQQCNADVQRGTRTCGTWNMFHTTVMKRYDDSFGVHLRHRRCQGQKQSLLYGTLTLPTSSQLCTFRFHTQMSARNETEDQTEILLTFLEHVSTFYFIETIGRISH